MLKNIKYHFTQFIKERIVYHIPLFKTDKNTLLFIHLDGVGDYILLRNFLPSLMKADLFKGKKVIFIGNYDLKDFVLRFDTPFFNEYVWVNFGEFAKMSLWQRWIFIINNIRKYRAETAILASHTRAEVEDLFILSSGANDKIAIEINDEPLGFTPPKNNDKLFNKLIPPLPYYNFQFERNRHFLEQLINEKITIQRTSITGVICKKKEDLISLYPGASVQYRRWSPQHFAELALLIHQEFPNFSFQILGGLWEIQIGTDIIKNLPVSFPIQSLCGQTLLDELVEKIAESRLLISNETSGPHFAAALDVPCVCISNGNHFKRFHPYPSNMTAHSLTVYPTDDFYDERYSDHLAEQFRHWKDSGKLSDINMVLPERVFEFVKTLLNTPISIF